ncbi:MAG: archease [Candidatus Micrarchaeia archaeon]
MKYKYLSHTAEKKFVAYGSSFKEALENAAEAMLGIMLDIKKIRALKADTCRIKIRQKASTAEDLVWYVLQNMLTQIDEKSLNAYAFKIIESNARRHEIIGYLLCKKSNQDFSMLEIKAVTPSELSVRKGRRWSITVVVDV